MFEENNTELLLFVDASQSAYTAVVYACTTMDGEIYSNLVTEKTRVALIKNYFYT